MTRDSRYYITYNTATKFYPFSLNAYSSTFNIDSKRSFEFGKRSVLCAHTIFCCVYLNGVKVCAKEKKMWKDEIIRTAWEDGH